MRTSAHSFSAVCETLFIPLYARAREQHQVPTLLKDPLAQELVQKIDYDFAKFEQAPASMTGVVLRAAYFDAIVRQFVKNHTNAVVVHLGYGLDTRCQRLGAEVADTPFYQIDVPEVITFRKQLLAPLANETYIASCMFETTWMEKLHKKHPRATFAFVMEGVLMYFSPEQNQQLFAHLAQRFAGAELHFDVISRWLSTGSNWHDAVRLTPAQFQFGIDDDRAIEQWHAALRYQGSCDVMSFEGWERAGWLYWLGQQYFPVLRSAARVVAYFVQP